MLGAFDTSYFPEISDSDDRSSYQSPLNAINQRLRRKNVVAAAAVSAPNMSFRDPSDPWGSAADSFGGEDTLRDHPSTEGFCTCKSQRRGSWAGITYMKPALFSRARFGTDDGSNIPQRRKSSSHKPDSTCEGICSSCGKKLTTSLNSPWDRPRLNRRNSTNRTSLKDTALEDPQHAKALLHATPRLRHLSAASTDMQGGGRFPSSRNILSFIMPPPVDGTSQKGSSDNAASGGSTTDYNMSLVRDRANQQAASELASLLWVLAHEMSLEDYGIVESEVFTSVFALVHDTPDNERRMAGLAALDALIDAPSADEEKKGIKFANALSTGLRSAHGDFEFLSAVSKALGHMALRTANVDFVESEVTRALEWLRTERSDRR